MRSVFRERPDPAALRARLQGARWLGVWLPTIVAMTVIAIESTSTFSAENTSGWIRPVIERFLGHINDTVWAIAHHLMRKSGHFLGYGMVCLTFLRAWLMTLGTRSRLTTRSWWLISSLRAIGLTALVASLDEWHQTFLPSRTGTPWDVGLDTLGATAWCVLMWVFFRLSSSRRSRASLSDHRVGSTAQ